MRTRTSLLAGLAMALCGPAAAAPPPVSFAAPVNHATGAQTAPGWSETTLVTADFNNDGRADLVSTDLFAFPQKAPIVQLNLGNGAFQSPGTRLPSSANGAGALGTGDFNFDGKADLIVSTTTALKVYLGNGNGTFTQGGGFTASLSCQTPVIADFNLDGKPDIATVGIASGGVLSVLRNTTP